jgi:hypothetical protein
MNSLTPQLDLLRMALNLRDMTLNAVSDADLAYKLPGANPSLGELFRELGETQHVYAEGFKTFKQDFAYRHPDPSIANSKARLSEWFKSLDADFTAAITTLSEDDIQSKTVVRPHWEASVTIMYHTYRECFLIFGAKAICYLRALEKPIPDQVLWWMG